jgi:uncharacterized damage-inducible protein DinB
MTLEQLRYPIGPWTPKQDYTPDVMAAIIDRIAQLPAEYTALTANLSDDDLGKQYREGSFTVRQLVHHVADIHIVYLIRFKNALLVSGQPAFMSDVNGWANLEEARTSPVAYSLMMFEGAHQRIAHLARTLTTGQLDATYYHPLRQREISLTQALDMAVWHAEHHLGHIRIALAKE